jgi:sialic acid synthase SpsE
MPQAVELQNRTVARKSLVAAASINAGDKFSAENLTSKRPGTGLSPMEYWRLLDRISHRRYEADDLLE